MFNEMSRAYTKTRRAEAEEATRRRIVEAAIALHEQLGPRSTTVSAIAEKAGVQRLTVYRHFPDDTSLFRACTSGWLEANPPPDVEALGRGLPPLERLRAALGAYHHYYRETQGMQRVAEREGPAVPALAGPLAEMREAMEEMVDGLAASCGARGEARTAIGHALAFSTWADLADRGLSDEAITRLTWRWIQATL